MIRRSTVVYILILLAVAGLYFFMKSREQSAEPSATPEATEEVSYLFTAEKGTPTSILIQAKSGEEVELARSAENAWIVKQPLETEAEQGSSEAAASQVSAMRILERTQEIDPDVVGLKEPDYILTVKFTSGTERTVRIGVITPSESGYYVQNADGGEVLIVSKSSVDALLRLLTSPPYQETPTPAASDTNTAP